jgi:DNA-binding SARP family transcriptional activator
VLASIVVLLLGRSTLTYPAPAGTNALTRAAELGRPDLPQLHEPDVAEAVGPLAVAAGSRAAASAQREQRPYLVTLLGGFAVVSSGRALEPPAGRPSTLVKLLALAEGPLAADEAVETLWPGVEQATGRQRLRNLLNRLRTSCGELVQREGETLVLGPSDVDARGFERAAAEAAAAQGTARPGLARTALARYTGELLPGDRYEPWATGPRERLRRRYLELLDLLADDAVERGDVDEAIRLLDQAQSAEPLDEERYVRAAELLLFQGRRGSAQALVERAWAPPPAPRPRPVGRWLDGGRGRSPHARDTRHPAGPRGAGRGQVRGPGRARWRRRAGAGPRPLRAARVRPARVAMESSSPLAASAEPSDEV